MTNKRCKPVNWRQQCQEQEGWVAYPDTQDWHAPITGGVQRALSRRKSLTLRPGFMGKLSNPNLSPLSTWNTHILFVLKPASFQIRGEVQLKAVQGLLMCFFLPPPSLWTFRCASWSQLMIVSCSKQHLSCRRMSTSRQPDWNVRMFIPFIGMHNKVHDGGHGGGGCRRGVGGVRKKMQYSCSIISS